MFSTPRCTPRGKIRLSVGEAACTQVARIRPQRVAASNIQDFECAREARLIGVGEDRNIFSQSSIRLKYRLCDVFKKLSFEVNLNSTGNIRLRPDVTRIVT